MPTVNIQISDAKRIKNNVTFLAVADNDDAIERTLEFDLVDNWTDFADWLINQQPDYKMLPAKEKSLAITFHTETVIDPESGEEGTIKVIDNVIVT